MTPRSPWRLAWLSLGWALVVVSPLVGLLPGPGGIFVFAAGLVLLLRHSGWARRRYVAAKRRWPRLGALGDRALRRPRRAAAIDFGARLP